MAKKVVESVVLPDGNATLKATKSHPFAKEGQIFENVPASVAERLIKKGFLELA